MLLCRRGGRRLQSIGDRFLKIANLIETHTCVLRASERWALQCAAPLINKGTITESSSRLKPSRAIYCTGVGERA